ncbi:MAG: hypothetical protein JWP57_4511, partial [Spirosoma sp.]|nr:hypothetical protein [Spirosoma sp.]
AGGVDRFYPSGHDALLRRIVDSGAVVSELPCGASPTKWRFLHRKTQYPGLRDSDRPRIARWRPACQHRYVGFFDSIAHALGNLRPSDAQLADQYEALRLRYVSTQNVNKATKLYNVMRSLDNEMVRRANKAYLRANPNATTRHREHGWYLPNDD